MVTKALVLMTPLKVLRECADALVSSLTTLFELNLPTCTLPEEWKYSNVAPIYKKRQEMQG